MKITLDAESVNILNQITIKGDSFESPLFFRFYQNTFQCIDYNYPFPF